MTDQQKISSILKRREYFDLYFPAIERCDARQDISYALSNSCPICGYMTLGTRCDHDICSFCFWQDDGQDSPEADKDYIGPNSVNSITAHRLEIYNWMIELKQNKTKDNSIQNKLGQDLTILDNFILSNELDRQIVKNQIELLSKRFNKFRNINSDGKPNWKFLTEKRMTEIKSAYTNSLPKAGRSWLKKLFGS